MTTASLVSSGLFFYIDPGNIVSNRGENVKFVDKNNTTNVIENTRVLRNIVSSSTSATTSRSFANFAKSTITNGALNLLNDSMTNSVLNSSYLRFENVNNFQTICMWVRINGIYTSATRVFLDATSDLPNSTISSSSIGSNWTRSGCVLYENDTATSLPVSWSNIEKDVGLWRFITVVNSSPASVGQTNNNKLTLFANLNLQAGMNVSVGPIMFYNRTLSTSEIQTNYNYFKNRFLIDVQSFFPLQSGLIGYINFGDPNCYNPLVAPGVLNNLVSGSPVTVEFTNPTETYVFVSNSVIKLNNIFSNFFFLQNSLSQKKKLKIDFFFFLNFFKQKTSSIHQENYGLYLPIRSCNYFLPNYNFYLHEKM